jgi:hypothetical protein
MLSGVPALVITGSSWTEVSLKMAGIILVVAAAGYAIRRYQQNRDRGR